MAAGCAPQCDTLTVAPMPYRVVKIAGLQNSTRRAIALMDGDSCEANAAFLGLSGNHERNVRSRFDAWIDGQRNDNLFHGWPNLPDYKECWSFRWRESKVRCRLYGFLCNPRKSDPSFRVCVLTGYDRKTTEATDFTILDVANRLRNDPHITRLLESEYR